MVESRILLLGALGLLIACSNELPRRPVPSPIPVNRRHVFVTSGVFNGDLRSAGAAPTGVEGADALCLAAANAGGLDGVWRAWISDTNVDAVTRFQDAGGSGPWYLGPNASNFLFQNRIALTEGVPQHVINLDEFGNSVDTELVWTGTHDGAIPAAANCLNWTDDTTNLVGAHPVDGRVGSTAKMDADWTDAIQMTCLDEYHLYCFEM